MEIENKTKELGLLDLISLIWANRKNILKTTLFVVFLGVIYSFLVPVQYQVKTTMIGNEEQGSKLGGNLGGLASLAGINLGDQSSGSGIPPALYPKITSSIPFRQVILETELTIEGVLQPIKFKSYLKEYSEKNALGYITKYTLGLPALIKESIFGSNSKVLPQINKREDVITISREDMEMMNSLENNIITTVDDEIGLVTITVRMSEPLATAQLALSVQELLQNEVTQYKIAKAQETLDFTSKLFEEKKAEMEAKQKDLAIYEDRNIGLSTSTSRAEKERLQAQYDLALGVYNEVAKQLETAKIQVVKDTPSFTVIEPVVVPTLRKKPLRTLIVFGSVFVGVFIGIGLVFLKAYIQEFKSQEAERKK